MARGYGDDNNRDRWRDDDRERSEWRSGGQGTHERDEERGFFERAGQEIRSWFSDDDDDRGRSSWNRDREMMNRGSHSGGSSWDRDRERSYGRASSHFQDRSTFGGMAQGGLGRSGGGSQDRSFGTPRSGERRPMSDRSRMGGQGASRSDRDWNHNEHAQSWDEANRGQSGRSSSWNRDREEDQQSFGYGNAMAGSLGGFGNQTSFGSGQDDHYRSWRDRQMAELDRDYDDYCREREQQFHSDFNTWRSGRTSRSPSAATNAPSADLGAASNAGVGTTTGSITGSAGAGSALGSATGTGGSIQSDTTGSTETAGAGSSRSGSRSRS